MRFVRLVILATALAGCAGHLPAPTAPAPAAPPPAAVPLVHQHDAAPADIPAGRDRLTYDVPTHWTAAGLRKTQGMVANYVNVDDQQLCVIAVVGFNSGAVPMKAMPLRVAKEIAEEANILTNTTVADDGLRAGFDWRVHLDDDNGVSSGHVELVRFADRPGLTLAFIGYWPRARNAKFTGDLRHMADTARFTAAPASTEPPSAEPPSAEPPADGRAGPNKRPDADSGARDFDGTVPIPSAPAQTRRQGGNKLLADGGGLHVDLTRGWNFDFDSGDCTYILRGEKVGGCRMMLLPREGLTPLDQAKIFADVSRERDDVRTTSEPEVAKDGLSAVFHVQYLAPGTGKVKSNGFVEVRAVPNAWPEEHLLCAGMWQPDHPELEVQARRICRSIRPSTPAEKEMRTAPDRPARRTRR